MLTDTLRRVNDLADGTGMIVSNSEHRFLVAQQLEMSGVGNYQILLEPEGKNTAPAIALAAFRALEFDSNACLLVLPADHIIKDQAKFEESIRNAEKIANAGNLVTFGIEPKYPETGYGYIKSQVADGFGKVEQFVEKPDQITAELYLASGQYYWNSGMFMFKASTYLDELKRLQPEMYSACERAVAGAKIDLDFCRVDAEVFSESPADSIDYAVMEKTDKAMMVAYDGDWSDVGSWSALYDLKAKDGENLFEGDVLAHESQGNYVRTDNGLVAVVGVDDLVVVQTADAVLVACKKRSQDVKHIVAQLKQDPDRWQHEHHVTVHRPWGTYQTVDSGERHQVKRIVVKPGEKLSVQMHHHRAEHWIVVSGTAKVTNGEKEYLVTENESTYIPIGQVHALENPGKVPLHLVEVQSGTYLGEDDIVRFTDRYGRS